MEWCSSIYWQQYGIIFSSIRRWRQKREKKGRCSSCRGWVSESVSMGQGVSEWVKERSKKNHSIKMNIGTMPQAGHNKKTNTAIASRLGSTYANTPNTEAFVRRNKTSIRPLRRILILSTFESDYLNPPATWKRRSTWDLVACTRPLGNAHWLIHVHHAKEADPKVPRDICDPGQ